MNAELNNFFGLEGLINAQQMSGGENFRIALQNATGHSLPNDPQDLNLAAWTYILVYGLPAYANNVLGQLPNTKVNDTQRRAYMQSVSDKFAQVASALRTAAANNKNGVVTQDASGKWVATVSSKSTLDGFEVPGPWAPTAEGQAAAAESAAAASSTLNPNQGTNGGKTWQQITGDILGLMQQAVPVASGVAGVVNQVQNPAAYAQQQLEQQKIQAAAEQKNKSNTFIYLGIGGLILLGVIFIIFYFANKK